MPEEGLTTDKTDMCQQEVDETYVDKICLARVSEQTPTATVGSIWRTVIGGQTQSPYVETHAVTYKGDIWRLSTGVLDVVPARWRSWLMLMPRRGEWGHTTMVLPSSERLGHRWKGGDELTRTHPKAPNILGLPPVGAFKVAPEPRFRWCWPRLPRPSRPHGCSACACTVRLRQRGGPGLRARRVSRSLRR